MRTGRSSVAVLAAMSSLMGVRISDRGGGDPSYSSNNEDGENGKQKVGMENIKKSQQVQPEYTTKDDEDLVRSARLFSVGGEETTG